MRAHWTILLAVVTTGCATTKVTDTWADPVASSATFNKVLVVALVPAATSRRNLEEHLASELRKGGIESVSSAQVMPEGATPTSDSVKELVTRDGFDAVLVTEYLGTERKTESVPATYDSYIGFYAPMYYSPSYIRETETVKLESRLFDAAANGKMVWSASTSTFDPESADKAIPTVAEKIVNQLEKDVPNSGKRSDRTSPGSTPATSGAGR